MGQEFTVSLNDLTKGEGHCWTIVVHKITYEEPIEDAMSEGISDLTLQDIRNVFDLQPLESN